MYNQQWNEQQPQMQAQWNGQQPQMQAQWNGQQPQMQPQWNGQQPTYGYGMNVPAYRETEQTRRMKDNFLFFGIGTLVYAVFYAFCMFKNDAGITFPLFIVASVVYLRCALIKLEIKLGKGSVFYIIGIMLLAVSTFCTDDGRIIFFNKVGIFSLMMSLLLNQFYNTKRWTFGKYIDSIVTMTFASIGELLQPFSDGARFFKKNNAKKNSKVMWALLGCVIAVPLVAFVVAMLSSADAVFKQVADAVVSGISFENIFEVMFRVALIFFGTYWLISYLCKHSLNETVADNRKGEPVLAITINSMLTLVYLVFSVIQIVYLFMGKMQLPEGYTYAMYAREGFFQLLVVSALNLVIVLISLSFFRDSKILRCILAIMSLCTFIMIASSALRMIIYIRFYYMTFLRILVLWTLTLLFVLFVGVIFTIFKKEFPLFRYSMVVVTVLYIALSFSHPDYIIAKVNIANAVHFRVQDNERYERTEDENFFLAENMYDDYNYLSGLSADAAPVLIPYLSELEYNFNKVYAQGDGNDIEYYTYYTDVSSYRQDEFGYFYLYNVNKSGRDMDFRTFNLSRYIAVKRIEEAKK